jgi:hypothetical protein
LTKQKPFHYIEDYLKEGNHVLPAKMKQFDKHLDAHQKSWDKKRKLNPKKYLSNQPWGAIGGETTYMISPTSVGYQVTIRCACGFEIDATDYDNW